MRRMQLYLTDEQRTLLQLRAKDAGVPEAELIRRLLDQSLGLADDRSEALAAVAATAGLWSDHPDGDDVLAVIRGRSADERLTSLGL